METEYPGVKKKNGQGVYLQLKFSTKNCQVGFKMRRKKQMDNNTKINQRENFLKRGKKIISICYNPCLLDCRCKKSDLFILTNWSSNHSNWLSLYLCHHFYNELLLTHFIITYCYYF